MMAKMQQKILVFFIFVGILSVFLAGCASVRENEALFQARAAYDKAASDPVVSANAPVALAEAHDELRGAENANDEDEMTHKSYMTIKKTQIAVAAAQEKAAQEERQRLSRERSTILLQQKEKQIASTQEQMKAMEQELANLKAQKTERGYVVTLGDILFATNKADLMPGAQGTLDQVAAFLKAHPEIKVVVQGHTDNVGSAEYNMVLSKARAESVKSALIARGVAPERITTEGRGAITPVASNSTAAGRQQNRRVELTFTPTVTSSR